MDRRTWTRSETLVAFNIYCRTPFGRLHGRNPEILQVAAALARTPSALAMKCCNLAALDPASAARGVAGLKKTSSIDREVWQEFELNPESLAFEAEREYASRMKHELRAAPVVEWDDVEGLDEARVLKVRVNQQFFRSMILSSYGMRCAVCELPIPALLIASHIVPWSTDRSLRMNPRNGISLCAIHDRAFDRGLLLIADDYRISVDGTLKAQTSCHAISYNFAKYEGSMIKLPDRWHPAPQFLRRRLDLMATSRTDA
jgi:putative restriction endonuclease